MDDASKKNTDQNLCINKRQGDIANFILIQLCPSFKLMVGG